MFDIGWSELIVVGVVALIVVGPKELPKLFKTVGQFVGKARGMAREFQRAMERAADEAGVKEVKESFQEASKTTSFGFDDIRKTLNSSTLPNQKKPKPVDAAREHAERMREKGEGEGEVKSEVKGNGSEKSVTPTEEPAPQPGSGASAIVENSQSGVDAPADAGAAASSDETSPTGGNVVRPKPDPSAREPVQAEPSDRTG